MTRRQVYTRLPKTKVLGGAFLLTVMIPTLVAAVFTGTSPITGNAFGSAECFQARVNSVQSGEVDSTADGNVDVAITAVDTSKAFVLMSARSNSANPPDSSLSVELLDSTTVRVRRDTSTGSPPTITVRWNVVEYECGVTVQRGSVAGDGSTSLDIPITSAPTGRSFPLVNTAPQAGSGRFGRDDIFAATLTSDTNLRLLAGELNAARTYDWQVVTFDNPNDVSVQTVTLSLTGGTDVTDASALPTSVDPARTMVVAGTTTAAIVTFGPDTALVSVDIGDGTSVSATRVSSGTVGQDLTVVVHVIEFDEGTTTQHGEVSLAAATASTDVTLVPVDTSTSTAHSTSFSAGDGSYGRSDFGSDDIAGEGQATFELVDDTTLRLTRDSTSGTATFQWQVVQWGGPGWWNTDYDFRQQITVEANSAQAAPTGYTVPLTFDHAQLVTDGLSLTSGDDLRVLRFDGSTWIELDRVLDEGSAWNQSDTTIWLQTDAAVDAGVTDGSYWIYFGDASAGSPPADPAEVYLVVDDFEDGDLSEYDQPALPTDWYTEGSWTRSRTLTIPSAQVDADLTGFPVLVSFTDAAMTPFVQADGDDLAVALTDGTQLPHELVSWNDTTGELVLWVRVPTVSSSSDTVLDLWFGNPSAPAQSHPEQVWTPDHDAAWHLETAPTSANPDSTLWDRNATSAGTMLAGDLVAAQVGNGIDFDGTDDRLTAGSLAPRDTGELTVSGWVDLASASEDHRYVAQADTSGNESWTLGRDQATGELRGVVTLASLSTVTAAGPSTLTTGSGWRHVAMVWDGSSLTTYLDGTAGTPTAGSGDLRREDDHLLTIGADPDGSNGDPVTIDEVRVSSAARSAAWIDAEYTNQNTPGTFVVNGSVTVGTWTPAWASRKTVTLAASAVPSTQSDIVVPIDIPYDADLAASATAEALLMTDTDGTTLLPYWVESFDAVNGTTRLWVRVPTVDDTTDTTLYLYYDSTVRSSRQDRETTWAGYDAVWTLTG